MGPLYLEFNNSSQCKLSTEYLPTSVPCGPRGLCSLGKRGGSLAALSKTRAGLLDITLLNLGCRTSDISMRVETWELRILSPCFTCPQQSEEMK